MAADRDGAPGVGPRRRVIEIASDLLTAAIAAILVARLAGFAAGARLVSDESFHEYMARWIAAHGHLPRIVEGLYGGFKYFYPPLFHLAGAGAVALFGAGAFHFLNVASLAALLVVAGLGAGRVESRAAGRTAVLLLIAIPALRSEAVHLYVEELSAMLAVAALVALLGVFERPTAWRGALLGLAIGLSVLAKQSALVWFPVVAAIAGIAAVRRRWPQVRALAVAVGVSAALGAPYWIRTALYYGSPLYPVFGPDIDSNLAHLNVVGFTPGPLRFYTQVLDGLGPFAAVALAVALATAAVRRRREVHGLLWGALAMLLLAPLVPMVNARHALPLVACLALLSAVVIADGLGSLTGARWVVQAALLAFAGYVTLTMPNLRAPWNRSPDSDTMYAAIRRIVPADDTLLCIQTYDVFVHAGRPATWPIPWGQKDPPVEMFYDSDPDSIAAHLARHHLRYLLLPVAAQGVVFNSANFPRPFMEGVAQLVRRRRAELLWTDGDWVLVRVPPAGR